MALYQARAQENFTSKKIFLQSLVTMKHQIKFILSSSLIISNLPENQVKVRRVSLRINLFPSWNKHRTKKREKEIWWQGCFDLRFQISKLHQKDDKQERECIRSNLQCFWLRNHLWAPPKVLSIRERMGDLILEFDHLLINVRQFQPSSLHQSLICEERAV